MFGQGIRLMCPLGVMKLFSAAYSEGHDKVKKAKFAISSMSTKSVYQMQFRIMNPMPDGAFIL